MIRRVIFYVLILLLTSHTQAQSASPDSLLSGLAGMSADTNKVNRFLDISRAYYNESWEDAIRFADSAAQLAQELNFDRGLALAQKGIGIANYFKGEPVKAVLAWEQSLETYKRIGDRYGQANILSNLGGVFGNSDEAKALDYYLQALRIAEEIGDNFRMATLYNNIGTVYDKKEATHDKAIVSYRRAIDVATTHQYDEALGMATGNIGNIYLSRNMLDSALHFFRLGERNLQGKAGLPLALNNIGRAYLEQGNFTEAYRYYQTAYDEAVRLDNKLLMTISLLSQGDVHFRQANYAKAKTYYLNAEKLAMELNDNDELLLAYEGLAKTFEKTGEYRIAYSYEVKLDEVRQKIYNEQTDNKLASLQFDFDLQEKESEIELLSRDKELKELQLNREKLARYALIAGLGLVSLIIFILYRDYRQKTRLNSQLDRQKMEIESLLLNILPQQVATELQVNGTSQPRFYESASVLFTDFKGFTSLADRMTPQEVVEELGAHFMAFDEIIDRHNLEKIKTIGDAYMCAGGIPTPDPDHYLNIMKAARDIQKYMHEQNQGRLQKGKAPWEIRIGVHVGPLVAGVVGKKKYAYDIWGSTVNIASRMESNGVPGQINISAAAYELVKDIYHCTYRGKIEAKNVGEIDMYFLGEPIGQKAVYA